MFQRWMNCVKVEVGSKIRLIGPVFASPFLQKVVNAAGVDVVAVKYLPTSFFCLKTPFAEEAIKGNPRQLNEKEKGKRK